MQQCKVSDIKAKPNNTKETTAASTTIGSLGTHKNIRKNKKEQEKKRVLRSNRIQSTTVAIVAAATLQIINKCFNWSKFYVCTSNTIQQTNEKNPTVRSFSVAFCIWFVCACV